MPAIDDDGKRVKADKPGAEQVVEDPGDVLVESEVPPGDPATGYQGDINLSDKEFRYNPPLHNSARSVRVDLGEAGVRTANFYDEKSGSYKEDWAEAGLNTLRLGRIIQHYMAPGQASLMEHRWGFRFLYNPSTVQYVSSRNDSFVIDPRSETNRVLSGVFQNFQSISFTVLLDRLPDVISGIPDVGEYSPALSKGDREGILRYGTHWDMEALFRIANGEWNLTDRGKTSNIGVLMPSNARLILGPGVNFYGFLGSVTWNDEMFSRDMVPVRTRLDLVFRRHVDMTAEEAADSFPGIATAQEGNPDSGGGSEPGTGSTDSRGGDTKKTDALIPSGYKNGRSTAAAATYAESRAGMDANFNQRCLAWVSRQVFQSPTRGITYAYQVWDNAPTTMRFSRDFGPPRGAIVLWSHSIGGGAGHIAVALGNGKMATTMPGGVRIVPIKGFSDRAYLGWMPPYFVR